VPPHGLPPEPPVVVLLSEEQLERVGESDVWGAGLRLHRGEGAAPAGSSRRIPRPSVA